MSVPGSRIADSCPWRRCTVRFSNILGGLFGKKSHSQNSRESSPAHTRAPAGPADAAKQEKLRQAAASHRGVLNPDFARMLETADEGWRFPETPPEDPLAYLGNLEPLGLSSQERSIVREWTRELVEEKGERAVWNSRLRLKLELRYLAAEAGLSKGLSGTPEGRGQ